MVASKRLEITGPAQIRGGNIHVLEDFNEGSSGVSRRYRALPADHPLIKAWLKRKISEPQFNAGNRYRVLYEKAWTPTGNVDSTQLMAISRCSGSRLPNRPMGDAVSATSLRLIDNRMGRVNCAIVRLFCGQGYSLSASIRESVEAHPNGYLFRVREALEDLISVFSTLSLPDLERDIEHKIA